MITGNPYGAVPEALKDTRLTLRDLMASHMENKVAEGRLNLEKAKAETELALVGASIKRDEIAGLRDAARMQQAANQFEQGQAQQAQQFNQGQDLSVYLQGQASNQRANEFAESRRLQEKGLDQQATAEKARQDIALEELAIRLREEKRNNEVRTIGEWAKAARIPSVLLKVMRIDENDTMTRREGVEYLKSLKEDLAKHPSKEYIIEANVLKEELSQIQKTLANPKLPHAEAVALQKTYKDKMANFELIDQFIMAEKQPTPGEVIESAHRMWRENPALANDYKNFDEFAQSRRKEILEQRSVFHDDIQKLKTEYEKMQVSPNNDTTAPSRDDAVSLGRDLDTLKNMKSDKINITMAERAIGKAIVRGDFASARRMLDNFMRLSQGSRQNEAPVPAVNEKKAATVPMAAENIAVNNAEREARAKSANIFWGNTKDFVRSKTLPPGVHYIPVKK